MAGIADNTENSKSEVANNKTVTYSDIATKLLKDKFLLTALELHTELIESGREVKQLKDFFSNPGNFEFPTQEIGGRISRSESQVTLDSLDLTRYSEDGGGTDEKVAVLEFELRKAKETINALRNNLTVATESETSTPDKGSMRLLNIGCIKPHEQRALNFLINEYLLLNSYKLTSITFADENQSQDFDDWDDVGLNISKPPDLLTLYREFFKQTGQNSTSSSSTQTDAKSEEKEEKICKMETELKKLEIKCQYLETECLDLRNINANLIKENELLSSQLQTSEVSCNKNTLPNSKDSLGSESPSEKFEIIDKNMSLFKKRDSVALEDNLSNSSFNVNDWTNLTITTLDNTQHEKNAYIVKEHEHEIVNDINCRLFNINFSHELFKKEVFSLCYVNIPQKVDNEILDNILNHSITNDNLVHTLSLSLLKIIPNIILNKREEAIPLLISAVHLNTDIRERDKLLQQLFNLKKKPSDAERTMILTGIVAIAKFSGESLAENEILPQCWEQLTDKHVERRLLVAEACTALIPYVSCQIRNSLILSMLQQMLEDREEAVKETVIRALSLVIALCDDPDKYNQCEDLALNILSDPSPNIINVSTQILFPVLGRWALFNGRLRSQLIKHLLQKLNNYLKDSEAPNNNLSERVVCIVNVLENLLPFLLMSVVCNENILSNIDKNMAIEIRPEMINLCSNLTNPNKFYTSEYNVGMILYEFDKYISDNPDASWPEMDWVLDMLIPDLLNNLNHIDITQQTLLQSFMNLFSHLCVFFGRNFTNLKVRPFFQAQISNLDQMLSNFNQFCPSLNIIPVYLVSVLSYCDRDELSNVLKKFLTVLPLCGTPLDCLEIAVKGLCESRLQDTLVTSLWEGVVHQRPLVRAVTANLFSVVISNCDKNLLNLKVTPALVTLANDSDILVKTAAIPALGTLITDCSVKEVHDKAYMQIQSYFGDTSLRENHTLLRQLIVTLGTIVNSCSTQFRHDVIIPHLTSLTNFMAQMTNQTRKIDMAHALVEAFTSVVYGCSNKENLTPTLISALRCLEVVVTENQSLICHKDTVLSMIRECDDVGDSVTPQTLLEHGNKFSQNVNQGVEDMKQRVSKIFTKPVSSKQNSSLPNLQGIFKKK